MRMILATALLLLATGSAALAGTGRPEGIDASLVDILGTAPDEAPHLLTIMVWGRGYAGPDLTQTRHSSKATCIEAGLDIVELLWLHHDREPGDKVARIADPSVMTPLLDVIEVGRYAPPLTLTCRGES